MLPITSLLLFHIQLLLNIFGNIIVSLKRGTLLDVPDEAFEVMSLQFVLPFADWVAPAVWA